MYGGASLLGRSDAHHARMQQLFSKMDDQIGQWREQFGEGPAGGGGSVLPPSLQQHRRAASSSAYAAPRAQHQPLRGAAAFGMDASSRPVGAPASGTPAAFAPYGSYNSSSGRRAQAYADANGMSTSTPSEGEGARDMWGRQSNKGAAAKGGAAYAQASYNTDASSVSVDNTFLADGIGPFGRGENGARRGMGINPRYEDDSGPDGQADEGEEAEGDGGFGSKPKPFTKKAPTASAADVPTGHAVRDELKALRSSVADLQQKNAVVAAELMSTRDEAQRATAALAESKEAHKSLQKAFDALSAAFTVVKADNAETKRRVDAMERLFCSRAPTGWQLTPQALFGAEGEYAESEPEDVDNNAGEGDGGLPSHHGNAISATISKFNAMAQPTAAPTIRGPPLSVLTSRNTASIDVLTERLTQADARLSALETRAAADHSDRRRAVEEAVGVAVDYAVIGLRKDIEGASAIAARLAISEERQHHPSYSSAATPHTANAYASQQQLSPQQQFPPSSSSYGSGTSTLGALLASGGGPIGQAAAAALGGTGAAVPSSASGGASPSPSSSQSPAFAALQRHIAEQTERDVKGFGAGDLAAYRQHLANGAASASGASPLPSHQSGGGGGVFGTPNNRPAAYGAASSSSPPQPQNIYGAYSSNNKSPSPHHQGMHQHHQLAGGGGSPSAANGYGRPSPERLRDSYDAYAAEAQRLERQRSRQSETVRLQREEEARQFEQEMAAQRARLKAEAEKREEARREAEARHEAAMRKQDEERAAQAAAIQERFSRARLAHEEAIKAERLRAEKERQLLIDAHRRSMIGELSFSGGGGGGSSNAVEEGRSVVEEASRGVGDRSIASLSLFRGDASHTAAADASAIAGGPHHGLSIGLSAGGYASASMLSANGPFTANNNSGNTSGPIAAAAFLASGAAGIATSNAYGNASHATNDNDKTTHSALFDTMAALEAALGPEEDASSASVASRASGDKGRGTDRGKDYSGAVPAFPSAAAEITSNRSSSPHKGADASRNSAVHTNKPPHQGEAGHGAAGGPLRGGGSMWGDADTDTAASDPANNSNSPGALPSGSIHVLAIRQAPETSKVDSSSALYSTSGDGGRDAANRTLPPPMHHSSIIADPNMNTHMYDVAALSPDADAEGARSRVVGTNASALSGLGLGLGLGNGNGGAAAADQPRKGSGQQMVGDSIRHVAVDDDASLVRAPQPSSAALPPSAAKKESIVKSMLPSDSSSRRESSSSSSSSSSAQSDDEDDDEDDGLVMLPGTGRAAAPAEHSLLQAAGGDLSGGGSNDAEEAEEDENRSNSSSGYDRRPLPAMRPASSFSSPSNNDDGKKPSTSSGGRVPPALSASALAGGRRSDGDGSGDGGDDEDDDDDDDDGEGAASLRALKERMMALNTAAQPKSHHHTATAEMGAGGRSPSATLRASSDMGGAARGESPALSASKRRSQPMRLGMGFLGAGADDSDGDNSDDDNRGGGAAEVSPAAAFGASPAAMRGGGGAMDGIMMGGRRPGGGSRLGGTLGSLNLGGTLGSTVSGAGAVSPSSRLRSAADGVGGATTPQNAASVSPQQRRGGSSAMRRIGNNFNSDDDDD